MSPASTFAPFPRQLVGPLAHRRREVVTIAGRVHIYSSADPHRCRCGWRPNRQSRTWNEHVFFILEART